MAQNVVGLDIGTHAVRAAQLARGRGGDATLTKFGQVTLPVGAVRDGELVDIPAVSAAIKRLWSEVGFTTRRVIIGAGNQRVVVRQADLPEMSDEDLRSALQFEAQELIPIPIDEAILDFQILHPIPNPDPDGDPLMRVLLVAAHRDMVQSLVAAAEWAGLGLELVDVVPFALIRAVGALEAPLTEDAVRGTEAIVSIGAGVTNVVVHEAGVPRFVRILLSGGAALTDAIAEDLEVDVDTAEDLKRRADVASVDTLESRAGRIVGDRLTPLVDDIRGSLDFYLAQPESAPIGRVLVTGGATRTTGLVQSLEAQLRLPVERAHPLARVSVGKTGIPEADLVDAEPLLAVPIGLALAGRPPETGRRLTLLPREVEFVRAQRRQALMAAGGVGALALLLLGAWVAAGGSVNSERDKADETEAEVARLRQQTAGLEDATNLQTQLDQRREVVAGILANDIAWTRLLQQISTVIPNDVWLTSFAGSTGAGGGGAGTLNLAAMGFDHTSAARWLLRVSELPSLSNLWLPSSSKQGEGAGALVTFQSTASLTEAARSDRAARYAAGPE